MVKQGHIQQESWSNKYWILAILFYSIHHIYQNLHQFISIFIPYKMLWMKNTFLKKSSWKCLWKTSEANNKLQDKWQGMIQNNCEDTIDWNLFIVK